MTPEEAANLMTPEAYDKLKKVVEIKPTIDMSKKTNNDILMGAFCQAVQDEIIQINSLDDKLIKLLNSPTNTLSQDKLKYLLEVVQRTQSDIKCVITIMTGDMNETIYEVHYFKPNAVDLLEILKWLLDKFNITPGGIRTKMAGIFKPTIVNNISQLVSRVQQGNTDGVVVSIATITRIVNCYDHLIFAKIE